MKKNSGAIPAEIPEKTDPVLFRAYSLMAVYAQATGAGICIHDHGFMPIPELLEEMLGEKNMCLFCIRHTKHIEAKTLQDLAANPCREMHINAIKESSRFGGSYTYLCPLGFVFWTSPIYRNRSFAGAVTGSGFLGINADEVCARMSKTCNGTLGETELKRILGRFPPGEPEKIKALAELMLLCAQSLSVGSEGIHETMKRRARQQMALSAKIEELKKQYPPGSPRPEYPLEKERELLNVLHRGDAESGKKILNEILGILFFFNPGEFKYIQYRAIELTVLLSRMDTGPGVPGRTILETNNQYIKSVQEANTIEELSDVLYRVMDDIACQVVSFRGIQHASALRKAEHFILENFTRKISLEEIAKISGFSPPYFSTIFKNEMGENLSSYLNRLRVEKASYMLTNTNIPLSKIATDCGFEDQSWFSKIFKLYNGISPGKYRNQGEKQVSSIPETGFSDDYRRQREKTK
ncbi:MAG: helix-turn-helix domain-containing protein [Treponema sp.]|nr:helix-turn-helix domain-containing protein [Treponema sp.]